LTIKLTLDTEYYFSRSSYTRILSSRVKIFSITCVYCPSDIQLSKIDLDRLISNQKAQRC